MSGNRRKNTTSPIAAEEQPVAVRVVAIPKNPEQPAGKAPQPPKPTQERIGTILRNARLEKNEDLYLIAEYLRIKPAFLIALENSQYDEFPADAYVIGFLRTYASFLGVDGKEAVDRYRYEMAGRRKKPVLSMPIPVSGGRTPSAVILVGATVAVLLIYAVWYSFSSSNRAEVNLQPALPTVTQPLTPTASTTTAPPGADGLTAPVTTPSSSLTTTTPVNTVPAADAIPPASPGIEMKSDAPKPEQHALDAKDDTTVKVSKDTKDVKDSKDAKDTKDATDSKDGKKHVFGDPDKVSRIIIRATQSSWIMVTDNSGKAVFDHVMKPGDIYKVPNQPGLSLTTGNGNGIILSLDGTDLPKVATGAPHVVRDISLDPEHMTSDSSNTDQ